MTDAVPAWAQSDERHPEREAEWRRLTADLAEARGMVAAITAAAAPRAGGDFSHDDDCGRRGDHPCDCAAPALRRALRDTAAAARAHDERVRGEALEDAAKVCDDAEKRLRAAHDAEDAAPDGDAIRVHRFFAAYSEASALASFIRALKETP